MDGSLSPQWATAEPTLQIPSVSFEDEGTYECEAENSKGRDSVQGRIIVQGTRQDTLSPPSPSSLTEDVLPKVLPLLKPSGSRMALGVGTEDASAVASSELLQSMLQRTHGRL